MILNRLYAYRDKLFLETVIKVPDIWKFVLGALDSLSL